MAQPKKVKSVCVPLDPDDCGSVVHGYVRFPELFRRTYGSKHWDIESSATVSLSDCNRVIAWNLCGDGGDDDPAFNTAKLDVAIGALMKLREYMVAAEIEYSKLKKEKEERNKLLPKD